MISFLKNKEPKKYSEKAQEKRAEQFMNVSTNVFTAVIVGVLVVPLTEMLKASFDLSVNADSFTYMGLAERLHSHPFSVLFFLIFYFAALLFSAWSRKMALDIYDRLDENQQI